MKTSLQELIHYIENKSELDKETLINKTKSLLEKEEKDLIDAFNHGVDTGRNYENGVQSKFSNDFDYFNQTFKQ